MTLNEMTESELWAVQEGCSDAIRRVNYKIRKLGSIAMQDAIRTRPEPFYVYCGRIQALQAAKVRLWELYASLDYRYRHVYGYVGGATR